MTKPILILAIESSCDDTSVALVQDGNKVLAVQTHHQTPMHRLYGGVVPEIASRSHETVLLDLVRNIFEENGFTPQDISAVAVTQGPGLMGSLLVGQMAAKALAYVYDWPILAIHHLEAHQYANFIEHPVLLPAWVLIVSGGHTHLYYLDKNFYFDLRGATRDDAIGEAFDKVARILGLEQPGGPAIERVAKSAIRSSIKLPKVLLPNLEFSYSGLKTAVSVAFKKNPELSVPELAFSFQQAAVSQLISKLEQAQDERFAQAIYLAGGVSANLHLRASCEELSKRLKIPVYFPALEYCTDNAAMIGCAGYYAWKKKQFSPLNFKAFN